MKEGLKPAIPFELISQEISKFQFPDIDLVIGIARGGIVPASMIAHQLKIPMELIQIRFRDDSNKPAFLFPVVFKGLNDNNLNDKTILLVDDVSVTGNTLETARQIVSAKKIYTFVLKGKGDYVLLPDIKTCVRWPWNVTETNNILLS